MGGACNMDGGMEGDSKWSKEGKIREGWIEEGKK